MAGFVSVFVVVALGGAVQLGGDRGGLALRLENIDYPCIGILSFVCK
jgi:hypothetical protein